jgi:hypothetical protein
LNVDAEEDEEAPGAVGAAPGITDAAGENDTPE